MNSREILAGLVCASTISVLAGFGYIIDCRRAGGSVTDCWLTGLPIAGIGAGAGGAFKLGYETLNPRLRRDDNPSA
jgi:hypothetical protein